MFSKKENTTSGGIFLFDFVVCGVVRGVGSVVPVIVVGVEFRNENTIGDGIFIFVVNLAVRGVGSVVTASVPSVGLVGSGRRFRRVRWVRAGCRWGVRWVGVSAEVIP